MNPQDLYQEIIMDHAARPRNFGVLENATAKVEAENPLCGDEITLYLRSTAEGTRIEKTGFTGQACAICMASASILTTKIRDIAFSDAQEISHQFQNLLTAADADESLQESSAANTGNLAALAGVKKFPMRIKCATLSWHALDRAMEEAGSGGGEAKLRLAETDDHS